MKPYYQDSHVTIYHKDCRDMSEVEDGSVDLVLTDPPYPDQHPEYGDCDILFLRNFDCRQVIFWSAKVDFPLDYTAIHIWDKMTGCASEYERLFERNGQYNFKVWSRHKLANEIDANYQGDVFYGHKSQKPANLVSKLVAYFSKRNDLLLDPFLGTGTTAYCAKKLNRRCIGYEIEEKYCEIAANRCRQMVMEL